MGMYTATSGTDSWMKVFGIDTEHIDQWEIVRRSEFLLAQNRKIEQAFQWCEKYRLDSI